MREMRELAEVPGMSGAYRRAMIGTVRNRAYTTLPDVAYRVRDVGIDPDALSAYARICGFAPAPTLPGTYPHVLAFPIAMHLMCEQTFPYGVVGLIHIANTITQHRAIGASELITFTVSAADLRPHERGRQFDIVVLGEVDGVEVWRGVSTYLRRNRDRSQPAGTASAPEETPAGSASVPEGTSAEPRTDEIWPIERTAGQVYARVSGDRNPIHTSWLGARAFGFPQPIAHGMWSAARCLAAAERGPGDAYTFGVAFKRAILLPSTVAFAQRGPEITLTGVPSGVPHLTATLTAL
jgi:hypothetical protein